MRIVPFELPAGANVLVAGAGGGFDFVCGLPLVLELEAKGHPVQIASYSFTNLAAVRGGIWHTESLLEVTADCTLDDEYFPERDLARWYRERFRVNRSIWCLPKLAVRPTRESYARLVQHFNVHTVFCVDGGIDGIFRGDEADLGTPSMDSVSVMAAHLSGATRRIYATVGFGVEGAEGTVSHGQALQRMAELTANGAALGVGMIVPRSPVCDQFLEAVDFIFSRLSPVRRSIMVASLSAALRGAFGRTVVHEKTRERPPWLSPLTSLVWFFDADAVATMKLFYTDALAADTLSAVSDAIERARFKAGVKPFEPIPI